MIKSRHAAAVGVAAAFALALGACGGEDPVIEDPVAQQSAGAPTAATSPAASLDAACPLVDEALLPTLFKVSDLKLEEKDPVSGAGNVATHSCDVLDGGELFLTVGFSVGPQSGTAQANVAAALSGAKGEAVTGLGEAGAFGVSDGVGTVAGYKTVGGKAVVVFVHGNPDDKEQLVSVAQSAAGKF
ncbi:MAG TPA: hypothetical protein VF062_09105 [Candidatus Limnocylindrales bacterium]